LIGPDPTRVSQRLSPDLPIQVNSFDRSFNRKVKQPAKTTVSQGRDSVPRLSIIVPYQQNDSTIESTLLSLLENRPENVEILLAHDGSYSDPYGLGNDELVIIDCDTRTNQIGLINQAVAASCSPVIQVIIPGTTVENGWTESAVSHFEDDAVAAVSPVTVCENAEYFGIGANELPRRAIIVDDHRHHECVPMINGGFFRRRTLLALNGFFEVGSREASEVEMGLAIQMLGYDAVLDHDSVITTSKTNFASQTGAYALGQLTGQLALAYSLIEGSQIVIEPLMTRLGRLATGLMNPSAVAERLGWVFGIRDRSLVTPIADRILQAEQHLDREDARMEATSEADSRLRKAA
jgi:hypothetical protein